MEHVAFNCTCNRRYCQFCEGGLFACVNCDSFEGATTTECPNVKMTAKQREEVYAGNLDFKNGQWVNEASSHSPADYTPERITEIKNRNSKKV